MGPEARSWFSFLKVEKIDLNNKITQLFKDIHLQVAASFIK